MQVVDRSLRFSTALGSVSYGEELEIVIPESRRAFRTYGHENGYLIQGIRVNDTLKLIPFGVEKSTEGEVNLLYIVDFGEESKITFSGSIGKNNVEQILNSFCSKVLTRNGLEAKSLSVEELIGESKDPKIEINLDGDYWLASTSVRKCQDGNCVYSIGKIENNAVGSQEMCDDFGEIELTPITKKVVAFLKLKATLHC